MARDVGTFAEAKRVQESLEQREAGYSSAGPKAVLDTPYTGGKVHPTGKTFQKPSTGSFRKHME